MTSESEFIRATVEKLFKSAASEAAATGLRLPYKIEIFSGSGAIATCSVSEGGVKRKIPENLSMPQETWRSSLQAAVTDSKEKQWFTTRILDDDSADLANSLRLAHLYRGDAENTQEVVARVKEVLALFEKD